MQTQWEFSVTSNKSVSDATTAVEAKAAEHGFRVLAVHDVEKTLGEKGFAIPPLRIVEICNAKYAYQALSADRRIALLLPCPIGVSAEEGGTKISTMLPSVMAHFSDGPGMREVALEVEKHVKTILEEAR